MGQNIAGEFDGVSIRVHADITLQQSGKNAREAERLVSIRVHADITLQPITATTAPLFELLVSIRVHADITLQLTRQNSLTSNNKKAQFPRASIFCTNPAAQPSRNPPNRKIFLFRTDIYHFSKGDFRFLRVSASFRERESCLRKA
ncbi:hypothetical protein [Afifella aestuarii]|uniref:hypothetical protein n=1 Tax=Afifella aestuarii TaxID=1909496 RepID=UPI003CCC88A9